jgi:hypothetical protein
MRLKTDWLLQEPIDLEHKQYILLDYISKVNEDLADFKLYPSFQELALHVASINRIKEKGQYITLNREPQDPDDEILITDLDYHKIYGSEENLKEVLNIVDYSLDKLTELFLVAKSIWTLLYDNVSIKIVHNSPSDTKHKPGKGFFYLIYDEELYIYQYQFTKLKKNNPENKCEVELIYQGEVIDVTNIDELISLIKQNHRLRWPSIVDIDSYGYIDNVLPIFRVRYEQKFPLEGATLTIAKRKVMNYIFQTIKISEFKDD